MKDGLSTEERDRLVRVETELKEVRSDVEDIRKDFHNAVGELRKVVGELRLALALQDKDTQMAIAKPIDQMSGIKLALVGIGGVIVFVITVLGGVLGAISFFRGH